MKKQILFLAFSFFTIVAFGQDKPIDIDITSISKEAIVVSITLSFAAIVRWFEKRKMKRDFKKQSK